MQTNNSNQKNILPDQTFRPATDIVARSNQDGTVIVMRLDESSLFYKINGIAAQVWSTMGSSPEARTVGQLVDSLTLAYPQHSQQLQQDIPQFLSELVEKKLVIEI